MIHEADQLVATYITQDPQRPGLYNAVVQPGGVPVWALAAQLRALDDDVAQVAREYHLPHEAVEAALVYYHQHQAAIDARIAANEVPDDGGTPVLNDAA
jgi:uncharacterized protein (DUF433 family)